MHPRSLRLAAVAATLATLALLSGCTPTGQVLPPATGTATPTASQVESASPAPSPSAVGTPITIRCDQLVTAQAMYDYNSNFSLRANYQPAPGSLQARALADKGIACSWVNQTSGETIEVAVAQLPPAELEVRKNDTAGASKPVTTYQVDGYFTRNGAVGEAQAFPAGHWLVASSKAFFEAADAAPIIAAAIRALG